MIIALAGRRIDESTAKAIRFPLKNVSVVKQRLVELFIFLKPQGLVCSAACGADLLALESAGELGVTRAMVLPFAREVFKEKSVTDRPGDWGSLFDKIYDDLNRQERVHVLNYTETEDVYEKVNTQIFKKAEELAEKLGTAEDIVAVIVWEGRPKDEDENDTTLHFKQEAEVRGYIVNEIITLNH